ncbi:13175_t:CDS:2 [Cetraspora pellucida]|uniref:13175_t:CDS:1 n=1 Tax=Cetraspora pellucida TaxID=1433469 RepID=A0A9N9EHD3_9GLOM|nr:13175_t:CDS:2 [Cetraspora pellucida]
MRFTYKQYKKRIYIDGHKREDVAEYHQEFLQKMKEYNKLMPKWLDANCEIHEMLHLLPEENKHMLVTHDLLKKKGLGLELHVSKFLTEEIERVWVFDNATSHTIIAPNALVASKMNLYPDGKQSEMKNTIWNSEMQMMIYSDNHEKPSLRSQPKGIKAFLKEKGL